MQTSAPFVLGSIMGSVAVLFRGTDIAGYAAENARRVRAEAADVMLWGTEETEPGPDGSLLSPLRAELALPDTKERAS
jgi:hypothetical protein